MAERGVIAEAVAQRKRIVDEAPGYGAVRFGIESKEGGGQQRPARQWAMSFHSRS